MRKRLEMVSFRLEELGLTHIRNKDVIPRNIANNQSIKSIEEFSIVCEPVKEYTRNEDGTEYKMHSTFALFADACVSDSKDSLLFDDAVS
ncbi:hypothetical protein [Flavobacterium sp. PL02]|uniref:hypothetical protein n=1 Tax=Flavobacterium sp. PL02 TaxID=3088354 RepID=UPI002B22CCC0|nr:hypothetical protein [Flavobacterium sp. PL02]MEA9414918.1 hypothetical protein [Flavobacterium sp. PL02]